MKGKRATQRTFTERFAETRDEKGRWCFFGRRRCWEEPRGVFGRCCLNEQKILSARTSFGLAFPFVSQMITSTRTPDASSTFEGGGICYCSFWHPRQPEGCIVKGCMLLDALGLDWLARMFSGSHLGWAPRFLREGVHGSLVPLLLQHMLRFIKRGLWVWSQSCLIRFSITTC